MAQLNIIEALNQTLHQQFEKNEDLLIFGEDVGHFGGVFRVTEGLQKRFGKERCFDTPLCEQGIVGFAIGIAEKGMKPIAEIQFADYIFPAYDQIVNELAKVRYRSGGEFTAPAIIRAPYGGGIHGGLYHSQSPEAQFLHTPGLQVVVVSSPYDAKGLLVSAIHSNDPVLFLEPKRIYRSLKEEVPEEEYKIPFGKLSKEMEGSDVTLIGWGAQHQENKKAAVIALKERGIKVDLLNLRTLSPLDVDGIIQSVKKTGRVVIAHEAPRTMGFAAEIVARIIEHAFLYLKAPPKRVTGFDTPFPHALEESYLPDRERVLKALYETVEYQ